MKNQDNSLKHLIAHLRFPFSFFLMPVFFFGLSQSPEIDTTSTIVLFLALHVLVYPASNGYNSLMDQDTGSIGGLEKPPPVPSVMFSVTAIMDILAVLLVATLHFQTALLVLAYIVASRAYSWRRTRLKKYPLIGFVVVVIFQGAAVFLISFTGTSGTNIAAALSQPVVALGMLVSLLLIGAVYPLTQVYQHEQDRLDGVNSMSMQLGIKGTFLFSVLLFALATIFFLLLQWFYGDMFVFWIFLLFLAPPGIYLARWFVKVNKNPEYADFKHAMRMNKTGAVFLNAFFIFMCIFQFSGNL